MCDSENDNYNVEWQQQPAKKKKEHQLEVLKHSLTCGLDDVYQPVNLAGGNSPSIIIGKGNDKNHKVHRFVHAHLSLSLYVHCTCFKLYTELSCVAYRDYFF